VPPDESIEIFPCFGGTASVIVSGPGPAGPPAAAAALVRRRLLEWDRQFSRFDPASELSQLNADPRVTVPVTPVMTRLLGAIVAAARDSGGLVDATLVNEIEDAGYADHFESPGVPLAEVLARAPPRSPARPRNDSGWRSVSLDLRGATVTRPVGLRFDSGGIAKGLFGDLLAGVLGRHASFAIDCGGDVRLGGAAGTPRGVRVASPLDGAIVHTFELDGGAAATSGIGRRSWLDADGQPAHHLLDPASGRPAFTGLVQVTALAPTGVEAEVLAKTALLRGPGGCDATLRHGGVVVYDDGRVSVRV
jgi:thiamine biosynthesis lipoprotein